MGRRFDRFDEQAVRGGMFVEPSGAWRWVSIKVT
jgi:hypothetical protein